MSVCAIARIHEKEGGRIVSALAGFWIAIGLFFLGAWVHDGLRNIGRPTEGMKKKEDKL
jgi:hypothetical protein